ncbi:L,D-transpeptidase family protein [Bartonella sp. LJL80]
MGIFQIIRAVLSVIVAFLVIVIAVNYANSQGLDKASQPLPAILLEKMKAENIDPQAPIYLRAFKKEGIVEVWKQARDGQYRLMKAYEICKWSGKLGPKFKEGDYQTPEGFYEIGPAQMHPKSNYHLAFNIGFPNAFDRANGRNGSFLMVHGACKSVGCYAMTDAGIEEIYAFARESFDGGQTSFPFHAFPFRLDARNMQLYAMDDNMAFWTQLKTAYDIFEITHKPPRVEICGKNYVSAVHDDERPLETLCKAGDKNLIATLDKTYQRRYMMEFIRHAAAGEQEQLLETMKKPIMPKQ